MQFELNILKTVAVLNLIDTPPLIATDEAVSLAVAGATPESAKKVKAALKDLQRGKAVLYFRGASGGYCLWPHTSVNLERAYQEALKAVVAPERVGAVIRAELESRPLVARRHYIETGNLRHFRVEFVQPDDLPSALIQADGADGRVLVALCENEAERETAFRFVRSAEAKGRDDLLVAVPQALSMLTNLLVEVQRWEWVARNVPELNHDGFALEEVTRQLAACRQILEKRVQGYIGLRQFGETTGLQWFYHGRPAQIRNGRALLEKLSKVCDEMFKLAPRVANELVNRHSLSSAAAAARLRLIERLLKSPGEPLLGMNPEAKPPEMSMYLSVLKKAGLHREEDGVWRIDEPPANDDPSNVRPVLARILEILELRREGRVKITEMFSELRRPPFGLRDGLAPLLLAVFTAIHERDVAFYENGRFIPEISIQEFQRITKAPETFEVQYCRIGGVRAVVFEKLFRALNPGKERKGIDILDVVRPLFVFASDLPHFAHRTAALSADASAVRTCLTNAKEPATLLFHQLPEALGLDPFGSEDEPSPSRVKRFVERLRASLDELGSLYPELLRRMLADIRAAFERPGDAEQARLALSTASERVLVSVSEPRLKSLCLRLADRSLPEREWVESIGSLLCSKPPGKWLDGDVGFFRDELGRLARQFLRVESTIFVAGDTGSSHAMRVAITCQDGSEVEQVVYLEGRELARANELESTVAKLLAKEGRIGLVAATRALWKCLDKPEKKEGFTDL